MKTAFSTNGARTTGGPYAKEENLDPNSHFVQTLTHGL